jgi:hypothetical protein
VCETEDQGLENAVENGANPFLWKYYRTGLQDRLQVTNL